MKRSNNMHERSETKHGKTSIIWQAVGVVGELLISFAVIALDDSPAIRTYKDYVSGFGLGWKVEKKSNLKFAESSALLQPLRYASVPKDADFISSNISPQHHSNRQ